MTFMGKEDEAFVAGKETLERLVCSFYQAKLEIDINEARYKLLRKKKKPPPLQSVPPYKDALLHIERASCQFQQWKKH